MKAQAGRKLIALILSVQLLALVIGLVLPKFSDGPPGGAFAFRAEQRMAALSEWVHHPSPETKATWEKELARLQKHLLVTRDIPVIALVLLLNGGIIYLIQKTGRVDKTT